MQEQLRNVQQVSATAYAFAAILADRTVVTWGDSQHGGNSSRRNRLRNVQHVHATRFAFAAILADGTVVTWGDRKRGGDCEAVQDRFSYL